MKFHIENIDVKDDIKIFTYKKKKEKKEESPRRMHKTFQSNFIQEKRKKNNKISTSV